MTTKFTLIAAALWAVCMSPALAKSADNPACARKAAAIETQLKYAEVGGNKHRARGLERALHATRKNCTDAGLIQDRQHDIAEQEKKLQKIRQDLKEKEREGRFDKVRKLERKLKRERKELEVLKQELVELEQGEVEG